MLSNGIYHLVRLPGRWKHHVTEHGRSKPKKCTCSPCLLEYGTYVLDVLIALEMTKLRCVTIVGALFSWGFTGARALPIVEPRAISRSRREDARGSDWRMGRGSVRGRNRDRNRLFLFSVLDCSRVGPPRPRTRSCRWAAGR